MLDIQLTSLFKKDYRRAKRRGLDLEKLKVVIDKLCMEECLEEKHRDHALTGRYTGFRECHIEPDWLLIYEVNQNELILIASRTGTHADLFGK